MSTIQSNMSLTLGTASELFVSSRERHRKTAEEDFHIKLQLRNTLTGRTSFMPELDFLEVSISFLLY